MEPRRACPRGSWCERRLPGGGDRDRGLWRDLDGAESSEGRRPSSRGSGAPRTPQAEMCRGDRAPERGVCHLHRCIHPRRGCRSRAARTRDPRGLSSDRSTAGAVPLRVGVVRTGLGEQSRPAAPSPGRGPRGLPGPHSGHGPPKRGALPALCVLASRVRGPCTPWRAGTRPRPTAGLRHIPRAAGPRFTSWSLLAGRGAARRSRGA